jgi:hypothetical protein
MLNICSGSVREGRHEECCYEGRDCPACEAIEAKVEAESSLADAKQKIQELDGHIKTLESNVAELETAAGVRS